MPNERAASTDHRDCQLSVDPAESADPIDRIDPAEPTLAIEATEPMLPMDRTDPREAIDNTESVDHKDSRDEPSDVIPPSLRNRRSPRRFLINRGRSQSTTTTDSRLAFSARQVRTALPRGRSACGGTP